jgi:hypothetical protein
VAGQTGDQRSRVDGETSKPERATLFRRKAEARETRFEGKGKARRWRRRAEGAEIQKSSFFIIKAGLKRAVAQGVKLGRPKIDSVTERKVRKQLAKGIGILKVAKSLGIGTGTVQRIANELR